jgi:putative phosphoribosyl transferase
MGARGSAGNVPFRSIDLMQNDIFTDRFDAAYRLAEKLKAYKDNPHVIILAIPRGGVELGYVLSHELHAPLDVIFTKKIGFPGNPEYAIGAMSLDSVLIDERVARLSPDITAHIQHEIKQLKHVLEERSKKYRGDRPPLDITSKIVIITDDGIATGKTLELTIDLVKTSKPQKIIVAIPVIPRDALSHLENKVDEVATSIVPEHFFAVSQFYQEFHQVDDAEAIKLLRESYKDYKGDQT